MSEVYAATASAAAIFKTASRRWDVSDVISFQKSGAAFLVDWLSRCDRIIGG